MKKRIAFLAVFSILALLLLSSCSSGSHVTRASNMDGYCGAEVVKVNAHPSRSMAPDTPIGGYRK